MEYLCLDKLLENKYYILLQDKMLRKSYYSDECGICDIGYWNVKTFVFLYLAILFLKN